MAKAAPKKAVAKKAPTQKAACDCACDAAPKAAAASKKTGGRSMALAAQLYTLRDHLKEPKQIAATLKRVAKIGYKNVQISGVGPIDAMELKNILDANGLAAIGHHSNFDELLNRFDALVDYLHTLGIGYTAIAWCGVEYRKDAATWKKTAKLCNQLGKRLADEGIVLQYHNHDFEFIKFKDQTGLRILYENSDPKYLQAEIDTAWVARGLQSPACWIKSMKGRTDQVHFKDTMIGVDTEGKQRYMFASIGQGNLNWCSILDACKEVGVKDIIVEQDGDWIGNCPFKALTASYKFLSGKGLK